MRKISFSTNALQLILIEQPYRIYPLYTIMYYSYATHSYPCGILLGLHLKAISRSIRFDPRGLVSLYSHDPFYRLRPREVIKPIVCLLKSQTKEKLNFSTLSDPRAAGCCHARMIDSCGETCRRKILLMDHPLIRRRRP
jgi:hypothetical protein